RHVGVGDRAEAADGILRERLLCGLAEAAPCLVEAGEVEVALGAEVAVEDRLGDACLAGDLGRRRAAVRRAREHAAGGVEHRLPTCDCREPRSRRTHAAISGTSTAAASARCRACCSVAAAITAPTAAITAATSSAWWNP